MSPARLGTIFRADLSRHLRRPLVWLWLSAIVLVRLPGRFFVELPPPGPVLLSTSEFSVSRGLLVTLGNFFAFFVAILAGSAVTEDDEHRVGPLIHTTPLRPAEYLWGKFAAALAVCLLALALLPATNILVDYLLPTPAAGASRIGPFHLLTQVVPTIVYGVPYVVFVAALAFALGARTRKALLVYLLPVVVITLGLVVLWSPAPSDMAPRTNRLLSLCDPLGYRWFFEQFVNRDRGVAFYNADLIVYDAGFLASRAAFVAVGLALVALVRRPFARSLRGATRASRHSKKTAAPPEPAPASAPGLGALQMSVRQRGLVANSAIVAASEARAVLSQSGLYLFLAFLVLLLHWMASGPASYGTAALANSGVDLLGIPVLVILLVYTVEAFERDRSRRLSGITGAAPVPTAAIVIGRLAGVSIVGLLSLLALSAAALLEIVLAGPGVELRPLAILWWLVLPPTYLAWVAFVAAVHSLTNRRLETLGAGVIALGLTCYLVESQRVAWAGNWLLFDALHWSDIAGLGIAGTAVLLNRIEVLVAAPLLIAVAILAYRRREPDARRTPEWRRPMRLLRLLPLAALPLVAIIPLEIIGAKSWSSATAREQARAYWKENAPQWKGARVPGLSAVSLKLFLDPERRAFRSEGELDLVNSLAEPVAQIPLTLGLDWDSIRWKLDGAVVRPRESAHLFLIEPAVPLAPGAHARIGFEGEGVLPRGIPLPGSPTQPEVILPDAIVLSSMQGNVMPAVGYVEWIEQLGRRPSDPPDARPARGGQPPSVLGSDRAFDLRLEVSAPADLTVVATGQKSEDSTAAGRRTTVWQSTTPIYHFGIAAGRWQEQPGEGFALLHHPAHTENLGLMASSLGRALREYPRWFGPLGWDRVAVAEAPDGAGDMGFPGLISLSESTAFLATNHELGPQFAIAHEAAHQWWGARVVPASGAGSAVLVEGMADFAAALLAEEIDGPAARMRILKAFERSYLKGRTVDLERPLLALDFESGVAREADLTTSYRKGAWFLWMLHHAMGAETSRAGLRSFVERWSGKELHPTLGDYLEHMRALAPDVQVFDDVAQQWGRELVLPEFQLGEVALSGDGRAGWTVRARVRNTGTGHFHVEIAAMAGDRRVGQGQSVALGAHEDHQVELRCPSRPDRLVVDPDVTILQAGRERAEEPL